MAHNLFENARITTLAGGTFINGNFGGTGGGVVSAADYEYHSVVFAGTVANTGTVNVYACANGAGSSPRVISTLTVGSGDGNIAIDVKSDALGTYLLTGTNYAWLSAAGTVDSGGTWRGALSIISTWPRSAGTSTVATGLLAYGTLLA